MAKAAAATKRAPSSAKLNGKPPSTRFDDNARYDLIRVRDLHVDHRVQRDHLNRSKLNKMREEYKRWGLGTLVVSERADGEKVIIDGQHRWTIAEEIEGEDFELECKVYSGLTVAEEAELFVLTNKNQAAANPLDLHKANVTRGDKVAVTLSNAALSQGWIIGSGRRSGDGPGYIAAVKVLEDIYHLGEEWFEGGGAPLIEDTLAVVTQAWTDDDKAVNQYILKAVGMFIWAVRRWVSESQRDDDFFDLEHLASNLQKNVKGGAKGWIEAMRNIADGSELSLQDAMRASLYRMYNRGLTSSSRKLPPQFKGK